MYVNIVRCAYLSFVVVNKCYVLSSLATEITIPRSVYNVYIVHQYIMNCMSCNL